MKQVTIEEARKILGDEAEKMSDDQLRTLIDDLSVMAKWALEEAVRNNSAIKQDVEFRKNGK